MTARDNSNDALEKEVNDTKEIEEFLKWYLDSYDDFFSRGRWGGAGMDPEAIENVKMATVMQVCALA